MVIYTISVGVMSLIAAAVVLAPVWLLHISYPFLNPLTSIGLDGFWICWYISYFTVLMFGPRIDLDSLAKLKK